jgi:hypothetical protein
MEVTPIMELAAEMIGGENGGIPVKTICFYPIERVQEIFNRMKAARGTDRETAELRIFAERMIWLYENQTEESCTYLGFDETLRLAAYGEAAEDAERTEKLEAGAGNGCR